MNKETSYSKILPLLFGYFVMGFVDLVGIASSYVKKDFGLTDTLANLLPMMVFLWFAVFSVPTSLLMNSIGRKKIVLISLFITLSGLLIPLFAYQFVFILVAFALMGIGNTILQVSLNPLMTDVVPGDRLTSTITLGQFVKAIASFLGPIIAGFAASRLGNWQLIFPFFAVITILSSIWLIFTPIDEKPISQKSSSFAGCFGLLKDSTILLLFLGIIFVVGVDVGLNTSIPKFLMERCHIALENAGLGTSLYFSAKTIGTFAGAILLVKIPGRKFFIAGIFIAILAMIALLLLNNLWAILALFFIIGLAVANVFPIIFSFALQRKPDSANEISGLMIMGIAGGAIVTPVMGMMSDLMGQTGGLLILLVALCYLLFCAFRVKSEPV
jgi:MFS transporter, FHS family, L-fucose permease